MKQVFSQNKFFLNCSPLEQFDSTSFYFFNQVVEFVNAYNFYLFEIEYSVVDYAYNEYTSFLGISTYQNFYLLNLIIFSFILFISKNNNLVFFQEFSHLFLGIFFALFFPTVYEFIFFTSVDAVWEGSLQVHFGLFFDENFISFLLAFFLLGGSEQEDDEDFLFESIDADFVDDIIAPLFIANLGKNIEGNGELLIKISSIFSFVLINNLMGMLPYSDTSTSSLILTFWVALSIFVSLLTLMIRKNGLAYFFTLFMPSGCPLLLLFLLIPIEFISYGFRLVSLSVRLFANMMAGHTLLKVIVGFSFTMILLGDVMVFINIFALALLFILTFLEVGVSIVQAYIFAILSAIYIKDIAGSGH